MNIKYRIPSKDPYGYVEFEYEDEKESMQIAIDNLEDMMAYHKGETVPGLETKDFNAFLDTYLFDGTGSADVYAAMSKTQQEFIQTLKRSLKRIKRNEPSIE